MARALVRELVRGSPHLLAPSVLEPGEVRVLDGAVLFHDARDRDTFLQQLSWMERAA